MIRLQSLELRPKIDYYEILEPRTAETVAAFGNTRESSPAITRNRYGNGEAIYVAIPANTECLTALLDSLYPSLGINKGPSTPPGVAARRLDNGDTLYVNTTGKPQSMAVPRLGSGLLSGQSLKSQLILDAYNVELVQFQSN